MTQKSNDPNSFLEKRRQILKLGAAGMPMVLTLRASAQQAVISQLRCAITVPDSFKILVDDTGAVWVGSDKIDEDKNGNLKPKQIKKFKENANFVFPEGSAPVVYRPDECEYETCDDDDDDDDDDDFDLLSHLSSDDGTYSLNDYLAGGGGKKDDSHDHNQCDDDGHSMDEHGHSIPTNSGCGYACYEYSKNYAVTPGEFVTEGGSWNLTGDDGLYLSLAILYAEENGNDGVWPGVSCIVSVLNYIGQ